jgi:hypothetical protein
MARLITIFLVTFYCCAAYAQAAIRPTEIKPPIEAESEGLVWDFGKVKEGEHLRHEFEFQNNSGKRLQIEDVHSSCGCTASEAKDKTLEPGEKTTIEVTFNSKGYSGAVRQFVFVNTDSPEKQVVKFTIKAQVEKNSQK